jgi:hypothetical protein
VYSRSTCGVQEETKALGGLVSSCKAISRSDVRAEAAVFQTVARSFHNGERRVAVPIFSEAWSDSLVSPPMTDPTNLNPPLVTRNLSKSLSSLELGLEQ